MMCKVPDSRMNYIIVSLLLVSCMSSPNYLLYFVRFCGGSTPKIANSQTYHKELSYLFNYQGPKEGVPGALEP